MSVLGAQEVLLHMGGMSDKIKIEFITTPVCLCMYVCVCVCVYTASPVPYKV